jgi:hypothetical protein
MRPVRSRFAESHSRYRGMNRTGTSALGRLGALPTSRSPRVYIGTGDCTIVYLARTLSATTLSDSMLTHEPPEEKPLQPASFAVHATRGIIRDQRTRRRVMVIVLTAALILMICGSTLLKQTLDPHEHTGWFLFFWLLCAWLTVTAILLAIFDLLMVSANTRKARRQLREDIERESSLSGR